jgi:hypothetical protein
MKDNEISLQDFVYKAQSRLNFFLDYWIRSEGSSDRLTYEQWNSQFAEWHRNSYEN